MENERQRAERQMGEMHIQANKPSDDPYAKDAQIKDTFREVNRLRMESDGVGGQPMNICDTASPSLETLEQEKTRLSRELSNQISKNEITIRSLRDMINELEAKQKSMHYLRENIINQSSRVQHDQVMELRRILGR